MIKLKRVYDLPARDDGTRLLIDRLWPRGIKKTDLKINSWIKEASPSTDLRKWFSHDPSKWKEFQMKYIEELNANPEAWAPIMEAMKQGTVTLIYSSHDTEHNNAVCLKNYLEKKAKKKSGK